MMKIKKDRAGFSMIELLVALAISSVIVLGLIEVFSSSFKSYAVQGDVVDLQQNLRIARSLIERDMRMTGSQIGEDGFNLLGQVIRPVTFNNGGEENPDKLTIQYINWVTGCGEVPSGSALGACDAMPKLFLGDKFLTTSSTNFSISDKDSDDSTNLSVEVWDEGCYCGGKEYKSPKLGFLAIVTDSVDPKSEGFIVTGATPHKTNSTVANGPNTEYDGIKYDNKIINDYNEESTISFFSPDAVVAATYELTKEGVLLRNDIPIADNVEDLQFAFCGDFDGDGTADCPADVTQGEWLYEDDDFVQQADGSMDVDDDEKGLIRFIHISILGKTAGTHGDKLTSKRPALSDREGSDTEDHFRRRLLQTTVELRNIAL